MDEMFGKLEKDKEVYILEPKDYVGAIPVRQDITVIPADNPKELRLGWVIYEEMGPIFDGINGRVYYEKYNINCSYEEYELILQTKLKEECEENIEKMLNSVELRKQLSQELNHPRFTGNDQYDLILEIDKWYDKLECIEHEQIISKRRTVK